MRYVNRRRVPVPFVLKSNYAGDHRAEIADYLERADRGERPPKVPFEILEDEELEIALQRLFGNSCAYCEQPLHREANIDAFRPAQGAENMDGEIDYQHYCWLALDWANLYVACWQCLQAKGNRFPVYRRGPVNATVSQLRRSEQDTLIDPCFDTPFDHFRLSRQGHLIGHSRRGDMTIDILDLNREELREQRAQVVRMIRSRSTPLAVKIEGLKPGMPFAGIAWITVLENLPAELARRFSRKPPAGRRRLADLLEIAFQAGYAVGDDEGAWRAEDPERRRYIRRVTVRNFRGLRHAEMRFPQAGKGDSKAAGSLVILGDNGAGKSSMLQACALGCLGPEQALDAGIDTQWCLTDGEREGEIFVEFWGTKRHNIVRFNAYSSQFDGRADVPVMVLGYGAYRLAARGEVSEANRGYDYRVKSLFDDRALVNGALGLRSHLQMADAKGDSDRLDDATRALNAVLQGKAKAKLSPARDLVIDDYEREQPLAELSSGFKSVIALVADIMDVMYEVWNGMTSAQALILVDEIDAHLHPSWRLAIVQALRDTFPLSQFLMTTHDPLPLRGLGKEEVAILTRDEHGIELDYPQVRSFDGMSVDQMLTSDLFGLATTLDEDTTRLLANYYALLALPARTPAQDAQLVVAENALPPEVPVGDDPRQRLMYRILDEYLARHRDRRADELSQEVVGELVDLFEEEERAVIAEDRERGA